MKYTVRINKKIKYARVYRVLKKTSGETNLLTKVFMRIFLGKKKEESF